MSMRWIRRNKTQAAAATAVVVGALFMAFALATLLFGGSSATAQAEGPVEQPSIEVPAYVAPDELSLSDQPTGIPPLPVGAQPSFPGAGANTLKGLKGNGGIVGVPKHRITLSLTSPGPIAYVGYIVPTSLDNSTGTVKDLGTSWSMTTVGFGPPDYAQMFSLAGPTGVPITCTITVDGKVTERRTTSGPYDQLFCQG